MDPRYLGTHYLSGCQWYGAFVQNQSLECLQITLSFDLCDLTLSRKRMASSEPAFRPSKEPFQESTYWTDTSNQSLRVTGTNSLVPGMPVTTVTDKTGQKTPVTTTISTNISASAPTSSSIPVTGQVNHAKSRESTKES